MASAIKEKLVEELNRELGTSEHVIVTEYQGLTAEEMIGLRAKLKTHGARYKVVKNRLAKIALKNIGREVVADCMKGPAALAYQGGDVSALLKTLFKFSKDHGKLKVKAGFLFGDIIDQKELRTISDLPSRDVLLATLLARLNGPLQTLVMTFNEPLRSLSTVLSHVARTKESAPAA